MNVKLREGVSYLTMNQTQRILQPIRDKFIKLSPMKLY